MKTPKAYETDLAYIHDQGYGDFARGSAPGLLNLMRQNEIQDGKVVDLGCGSGIWATCLSEAGYDVVGVDISPAMKRQAPTGYHCLGGAGAMNTAGGCRCFSLGKSDAAIRYSCCLIFAFNSCNASW